MIDFRLLSARKELFARITGVKLVEFLTMVEKVRPSWNEMQAKKKCHGRNFNLETLENELLPVILYYRCYTSYYFLGMQFNLDASNVCRHIQRLEPLLARAISINRERNFPEKDLQVLIDAAEIQTQRPSKNQRKFYSGKKKKHTHISESKFGQLLKLFCIDLTAVQMSEILQIERKTVNRILQLLRERIMELAEEESCLETGEIEADESYFGAKRVRVKRDRGAEGKTKVFGMKKRGDKVYTQIVKNCLAAELVPIIKRLAPEDSTIYSDEWKACDGLANAGYKKRYRAKHSDDIFSNGRAHVNGIENFWGIAKMRMAGMRGVSGEKFNLHLKETEWRFNHRNENIYKMLLSILKKESTLIYS